MEESPIRALTKGEWNCLRGVGQHLDSHQIATVTGFTKGTVDAYISAATRKLRANNRKHAVQILRRDYPHLFNKTEFDFPSVESDDPKVLLPAVSRFSWPWPTKGRPANDGNIIDKIIAVAVATSILLAAAAAYLTLVVAVGDKL